MKKTSIFITALALTALTLVTSCQKEGQLFRFTAGEEIRFAVGSAGGAATKTVYSGQGDNEDRTKMTLERIDWEVNDRIRIYCGAVSEPADTKWADYTVTEVLDPKAEISYAYIEGTGGMGLRWGSGEHIFYAVAPSTEIVNSGSKVTASASVSPSQVPVPALTEAVTIAKGTTYTLGADMTNMFMAAKSGPYTETGGIPKGDNVFLSFTPLTTAVQFTVTNGTADPMTLTSVSLISGNGKSTDEPVINGDFTIGLDIDSWETPDPVQPSDKSMTVSYGREYPACACTGDATSAAMSARTVTIDFGKDITLAAKDGDTKGGSLTFTFLLTPTHDFEDLTFKLTKSDDSWMSTRLGYTDGSGIFFPHFKKTEVEGLFIPEGAQWTIKYGPTVQSWNQSATGIDPIPEVSIDPFVTSWDTGIDEELTLEPKVDNDLLPGRFSVSETEYVQFSRGNLFCTRSGSEESYTYTFAFEQNQYDYRCRYGITNDNAVIGGQTTATPESTSGLFQWIPRTHSIAAADWGAFSAHSNSSSKDTDEDVLNFGDVFPDDVWKTLNIVEWKYLVENHKNKIVTVNGVKGLCIAPDNYPETGEISDQYSSATTPTWEEAETAGMVFLPYYGYYNPGTGEILTHEACYWSSTPDKSGQDNYVHWAQTLHFNNGSAFTFDGRWRTYGQNVRLVQKFIKPEFEPKFVDLGLPSGTLWADRNVGANTPQEVGDYYAWGETELWYSSISGTTVTMKPEYTGFTSKVYNDKSNMKTTKANLTGTNIIYDVAYATYGGTCHMPSQTDYQELLTKCYIQRVTEYNDQSVEGFIFFKAKNEADKGKITGAYTPVATYDVTTDANIFLPYSGFITKTAIRSGNITEGEEGRRAGYYFSSTSGTITDTSTEGASRLSIGPSGYSFANMNRFAGTPVRAVKNVEHDAVFIGGKWWATENIGASSPEMVGRYYAWGDVVGQIASTTGTGAFSTAFTKASRPEPTLVDGSTLSPDYDAAHVNWGGDWRMPTQDDIKALIDNTKYTHTANYHGTGVNGVLFTSKTDDTQSIFFPYTGYGDGSNLSATSGGYYWSATLNTSNDGNAFRLNLIKGSANLEGGNARYQGRCIRPVHD